MLSLFPQILYLAPLGTTLLRVTTGLVFVYLAYAHYTNHKAASQELSRLIGGAGIIIYIYSGIELALGLSLIAGTWTQLAALVGAVVALKVILIHRTMHELRPISTLSYALLAVMCLSLIFSGAGAFAVDLPL